MRNDQRRASHVGVFVTKQLSIVIAVLGLLLVTVSACDDGVSNGTAAEQGDADAQTNLGVMYGIGEGVIQSNVIAHMLANLAGAQGNKNGQELRDAISERMTPNDISRAQEMARVCLERNYKGCGF